MEANFTNGVNEYLPLRDVVFRTLREAILKGELKPGERLMEIKLANKLGVSRTPIREAIRKLELEGLVIMIPRKGAEVADITEKSLQDVLEVRQSLEELSVRLACERITKDEIKKMRQAQKEFAEISQTGDITVIAEADVAFHDIIYQSTKNPKLVQLLNQFREQMYRYRVEYLKTEGVLPQLIVEHENLMQAICSGKSDEAGKMICSHIQNQMEGVQSKIRTKKH